MTLRDRRIRDAIILFSLIVFGYFFQGDGWALESNWLPMRTVIERGSFDLSRFSARTGDIAIYQGRTYSNKPPGVVLLGLLPYWLMNHIERWVDLNPDATRVEWVNIRIMTFILCAAPAAALVAMMFVVFRREGAAPASAAAMCIGFACGSIVWPYAGMLYNHVLVATCLFGAWMSMSEAAPSRMQIIVASALLGVATVSEYTFGPLAVAIILFDVLERKSFRRAAALFVGPAIAIGILLIYQRALFGSAFMPSYGYEAREFAPSEAVRGRIVFPEARRLYWITFQRFRGIFYCCPVFAVALLSLARQRTWRISRVTAFRLIIVGYYVALLMTYRYWAGGSGTGPRFAIPALPFLFLLTRRGFEKYPLIAWPLALLSIFNMLAVSAVMANYTGTESGPPQQWDPVGVCALWFISNRIAVTPHSTNLGMSLGLKGAQTVFPIAAFILLSLTACLILRKRPDLVSSPANETA